MQMTIEWIGFGYWATDAMQLEYQDAYLNETFIFKQSDDIHNDGTQHRNYVMIQFYLFKATVIGT